MKQDSRESAGGTTITAGGALLARMKAVGIDYIFANSGTDFPPVIEGLAEAAARGIDLPEAIVIPHEGAAMGMAHGYFLATGRAQAVMAHTNVGLANCAIGAINAATEHVPVLLFSGRTPVTEKDRFGARTVPIGWGQEMRDQTALVREATKWDYELRFPEQAPDLVDRAYAVANSMPRGPVYLSLPREVLCEPCPADRLDAAPTMRPSVYAPPADAIERAAEILAAAERPVIFAQRGAGDEAGFAALSALASTWAIPVVQYWAVRLAIPSAHPMSAGVDPSPWIEEADAILVIDSLAPWSPDLHEPRPDCPVIHLGQDPLYSRFPVRNFRCDLARPGDVSAGIQARAAALERRRDGGDPGAGRRSGITARTAAIREKVRAAAEAGNGAPMSKDWVSRCLSDAIAGKRATVLSELGAPLGPLEIDRPDSWYQEPHSGGLGWCLPAALGMQLADRDRLVVATMGDGSYMFANPVACHQIAEAMGLPVLILVLNNAEWGAVRQSVLGVYPDGYAAKANVMPLVSLAPSPDFTKVAEASRAWTARVDDGEALAETLAAAIRHIEETRTHALVEIRIRR